MKKLTLFSIVLLMSFSTSFSQTRIVLVEQFTNSGCPPCASSSPSVYNYVDSNPGDVVAIAYHTSFPYNDSMYFENPSESNSRVSYYGVSGVPYSIVDGNYYENSSSGFLPVMSSTITARKSVSPRYDVQAPSLNLASGSLTGSFTFTSLNASNSTENLVAHIVVIEKNVLKSSYAASPGANAETEYGYVMRKMFPTAAGTTLINKVLGGNDTISLNWTLTKIKDVNELKIVAFVQNTITQEVYQSQLFTPTISPLGIHDNDPSDQDVIFFPNPVSGELSISLKKELLITQIELFNQMGQRVYFQAVNAIHKEIQVPLNLDNGIYFIKIEGASTSIIQKISIVK